MHTRKLGDLEVSAIGLGCMGMSANYGPPADRKEMISLLHQAGEMGVSGSIRAVHQRGTAGRSRLGPIREKVVLSTKFGSTSTLKRASAAASIIAPSTSEQFATRRRLLRTDLIDLFYQRRVDESVPIEDGAGTSPPRRQGRDGVRP